MTAPQGRTDQMTMLEFVGGPFDGMKEDVTCGMGEGVVLTRVLATGSLHVSVKGEYRRVPFWRSKEDVMLHEPMVYTGP